MRTFGTPLAAASLVGVGLVAGVATWSRVDGSLGHGLRADGAVESPDALSVDGHGPRVMVAKDEPDLPSPPRLEARSQDVPAATEPDPLQVVTLPMQQEVAALSQSFRDGSVRVEDALALARLLLRARTEGELTWNQEGWRVHALDLGDEQMHAELQTRAVAGSGQRELQFVVSSTEGFHDTVDSSFTKGARLELNLQLDADGALTQCRALSVTEMVPSPDFYSAHHGVKQLAVGGVLQAGGQVASWRPVTLAVGQNDGVYSMRQRIEDPTPLPLHSESFAPGFLAYDVESLFLP